MGRIIEIHRNKYDIAISLGTCCQTAYQLYRLGYRKEAYPFDWIALPFNSLYNLLKNKFDKFLSKEDLELREGYVYEKRYGAKLLHDFKYKGEFIWLEDYKHHYEKYWRRINRFLEIKNKRILFVRRQCNEDQAKELREVLRKYKFNFGLLVLDETQEIKIPWDISGIDNHYLLQRHPYNWRGINSEWTRVFEKYKINNS